ncbi:MAG TPA: PAS domain S-box protein [Bryobacteraceae bacterium]|nr:PAS domain S-box protein [Bryobacteraceae bacterium]
MKRASLRADDLYNVSVPLSGNHDRSESKNLVIEVARTVSLATGVEFFYSLIGQFARTLEADAAWIVEIVEGSSTQLRTLAAFSDGQNAANFEYEMTGTHAEAVAMRSGMCVYRSGVQELFPSDSVLRRFGANSFVGIPLLDAGNELLGMIAVVSRTSLRDTRLAASLFRILASRAAAELTRIRATEALRASEARLKLIFENAPDAYLLLSLDGKLLGANQTCEKLIGYSRDELIGRNVLVPGLLPAEDLRRAAARLASRAAGAPPSQEEFTVIHRDGHRLEVETCSHLETLDGLQVMLLCMRDITSRKIAQRERQQHDDRARELQAAAFGLATNEAVVSGGLNQIASLVTETVCRLAGAEAVSVWLLSDTSNVPSCLDRYEASSTRHTTEKLTVSAFDAEHRLALELGKIVESAEITPRSGLVARSVIDSGIKIRGKIRGLLRIECAAGSRFGQDPETAQFVTAVSDLLAQAVMNADRGRTEAWLRKSEARLRHTQRAAGLGSWERDLFTDRMECSDEVFRIFGVDKESFVPARKFFLDRVHPSDVGKVDAALNELLLTGQPCEVRFRIVRPDGACRYVREVAELEMNAAGEPSRLIGSLQDLTDLRQIEDDSHTTQRLESLGRLAGGIAQTLNNLLMVVNGYSGLIMRSPSNQSVIKNSLDVIQKAGEDASELIRQLQTFSQRHATEVTVIDLNSVVRGFDRMVRHMFGEGIDVVSLLEPELGKVEASPAHLNQILLSLAINAQDAMPYGGRLTMQTGNIGPGSVVAGAEAPGTGNWVMLAMSHTGESISETAAKEANGARDLGVSTVSSIVQQYGGTVQVCSQAAVGITVRLFLPRVDIVRNVAIENDPLADENIRGSETVLVVEDQPEIRTLAVSVLESLGYRVLNAPNADSAMRISLEYRAPIHLLLTDVIMPGVQGDELAERLRALRPSLKVIFMSGYTSSPAVQRTDLKSGTAFIRKPFDPFVLAARIRELLGFPSTATTVLIADDDEGSRAMLRRVLASGGYRVLEASGRLQAESQLSTGVVDLLVAAPATLGFFDELSVRAALSSRYPRLGVVLLVSEAESINPAVHGPSAGYAALTRPIQPDVLLSALRNLSLKAQTSKPETKK